MSKEEDIFEAFDTANDVSVLLHEVENRVPRTKKTARDFPPRVKKSKDSIGRPRDPNVAKVWYGTTIKAIL